MNQNFNLLKLTGIGMLLVAVLMVNCKQENKQVASGTFAPEEVVQSGSKVRFHSQFD